MYFWILPYIIYNLAQIVLRSEWHADKEIIQLRIKGTCLLVLLFNNQNQSLISYSLWMGGERKGEKVFFIFMFFFLRIRLYCIYISLYFLVFILIFIFLFGWIGSQLRHMGLVALLLVGYFPTRHQTCVPCNERWSPNHYTAREVLREIFTAYF